VTDITLDFVQQVFGTFEAKDLEAVMACFADDAVLFDPHYPVPEMRGNDAIRRGLAWGLGNMKQPGFTVRHLWVSGETAAVEVDTHHVFKGGIEARFPQVFVIESRDGLITRLQAYPPYGPPGVGRLLTRLTRLIWRLQGRVR